MMVGYFVLENRRSLLTVEGSGEIHSGIELDTAIEDAVDSVLVTDSKKEAWASFFEDSDTEPSYEELEDWVFANTPYHLKVVYKEF